MGAMVQATMSGKRRVKKDTQRKCTLSASLLCNHTVLFHYFVCVCFSKVSLIFFMNFHNMMMAVISIFSLPVHRNLHTSSTLRHLHTV